MTVTILGIIGIVIIVVTVAILIITRRSHLVSWRFGIFFESEERFGDSTDEQDPESG